MARRRSRAEQRVLGRLAIEYEEAVGLSRLTSCAGALLVVEMYRTSGGSATATPWTGGLASATATFFPPTPMAPSGCGSR